MKELPLYKQIKNGIIQKISSGDLRAGDLVPSESELMSAYKVSQITARNALSSLVDDGIIYRVQGKGSFVAQTAPVPQESQNLQSANAKKPAGMIGVLLPYLNTKLEYRILYYLDRFIYREGYQMLLHNCNENEREESETLENYMALGVKGLIVFPAVNEQYNEDILRLSLDRFPLVLVDRYLKGINTYHVVSDNFKATYDAISYLLSKGHRRIAYISPRIINSTTEDRSLGYEKAFQNKNFSIDKNLWLTDLDSTNGSGDFTKVVQFFKSSPNITAVFTANIRMFQLTVQALNHLGRTVPEDIEIFTFDEPECPNVNYILQDYEAIARATVDLLLTQKSSSTASEKAKVIPAKLVLRPFGH